MRSETLAIKSSMHSSCGRVFVNMFMRNGKQINGRTRGEGRDRRRERSKRNKWAR